MIGERQAPSATNKPYRHVAPTKIWLSVSSTLVWQASYACIAVCGTVDASGLTFSKHGALEAVDLIDSF